MIKFKRNIFSRLVFVTVWRPGVSFSLSLTGKLLSNVFVLIWRSQLNITKMLRSFILDRLELWADRPMNSELQLFSFALIATEWLWCSWSFVCQYIEMCVCTLYVCISNIFEVRHFFCLPNSWTPLLNFILAGSKFTSFLRIEKKTVLHLRQVKVKNAW